MEINFRLDLKYPPLARLDLKIFSKAGCFLLIKYGGTAVPVRVFLFHFPAGATVSSDPLR
jgi:hypothetical protein